MKTMGHFFSFTRADGIVFWGTSRLENIALCVIFVCVHFYMYS